MENKKIKNANPLEVDGIKFKSRLEVSFYKALLQAGFKVQYEPTTFIVWEGFRPQIPFYDRDKKTRKLKLSMSKIIDVKYTPDFIIDCNNVTAIIEAKGKENDVFYLKKKLFRGLLEKLNKENSRDYIYFEIYTKKQLMEAIDIIKSYDSNRENKKSDNIST